MTRRQRHSGVLIGVTILFLGVTARSVLMSHDFKAFFIGCGAYAVFLILYSLVCWLDVPKERRKRPDRPSDFSVLRIGKITPEAARVIGDAQVIKDQVFGGVRHQLFLAERAFQKGIWRSYIEVAGDRILAYSVSYESGASPILDRGEQFGAGRFLAAPE